MATLCCCFSLSQMLLEQFCCHCGCFASPCCHCVSLHVLYHCLCHFHIHAHFVCLLVIIFHCLVVVLMSFWPLFSNCVNILSLHRESLVYLVPLDLLGPPDVCVCVVSNPSICENERGSAQFLFTVVTYLPLLLALRMLMCTCRPDTHTQTCICCKPEVDRCVPAFIHPCSTFLHPAVILFSSIH